jgi:hypothetical protein
MFTFLIFVLAVTFLYFGGLEGVIALISGAFTVLFNIAYWIPIIIGYVIFYFMWPIF